MTEIYRRSSRGLHGLTSGRGGSSPGCPTGSVPAPQLTLPPLLLPTRLFAHRPSVAPPRLLMEPTIRSTLPPLVEQPSLRHCLRPHLWYLTTLAEQLSLRHCLRPHLWYLTTLVWCARSELTLRDPPRTWTIASPLAWPPLPHHQR
jgi:hypothetical protein